MCYVFEWSRFRNSVWVPTVSDRILQVFPYVLQGTAGLVFSYLLFYDLLPRSMVCFLQKLTAVNLNVVVRTAALLLMGCAASACEGYPLSVDMHLVGLSVWVGRLSQTVVPFTPQDRTFAAISILRVGF